VPKLEALQFRGGRRFLDEDAFSAAADQSHLGVQINCIGQAVPENQVKVPSEMKKGQNQERSAETIG
jgi:hypothetical protein